MSVRRLDAVQPAHFAFLPANQAWADAKIQEYPAGKQASAVIPILWKAQEQEGWVSKPAIESVARLLAMPYIRVLEIATFYTQFQLSPVGTVAHVQVCGTTPCMLRGAGDILAACKQRIAQHAHVRSADGKYSWEEVECLGACVNAPMVMVGSDTFEDLTAASFHALLDGYGRGNPPKPGPQTGRQLSAPEGGERTLTDTSLYDGSSIGVWRAAFEERERTKAEKAAATAAAKKT